MESCCQDTETMFIGAFLTQITVQSLCFWTAFVWGAMNSGPLCTLLNNPLSSMFDIFVNGILYGIGADIVRAFIPRSFECIIPAILILAIVNKFLGYLYSPQVR
jgi:hypothetical protein